MQTLEKYYPKEEAESSLRKTVVFEREEVTLVIPEDGIKLSSGWSILPMAHPASVGLIYLLLLVVVYIIAWLHFAVVFGINSMSKAGNSCSRVLLIQNRKTPLWYSTLITVVLKGRSYLKDMLTFCMTTR